MSNTNRVNVVFVGSGANVGSGALPDVKQGDLFIYDSKNNLIDTVVKAQALSPNETITIASGKGSETIIMKQITGAGISNYEGQSYVAPTEKVILIGNPADGGIDVTSGYEYRLRTLILDDVKVHGQRKTLHDATYPATGTATQEDVAKFIFCMYHQDEYGHSMIKDLVTMERVTDGTFTALTNNATVSKGSKIVKSTAHGVTVGDSVYLRIGGTSVTTPAYVATAIDANTLELDAKYVGATGTILAVNILKANDSANWGFKLTGLAQKSLLERAANEPVYEYQWINFDAVFSRAEDRAIETISKKQVLQELNPGQGFWKQVADREEQAKGYLGDTAKGSYDHKRINNTVVVGTQYDSVVISHRSSIGGNFQDTYSVPLKTEIYIPHATAQGTSVGNSFLGILNAYLGVVGFKPLSF